MVNFHSNTLIDSNKSQCRYLDVMVVFGSPRNNCKHSGICKVYVLPAEKAASEACHCPFKAQGKLLFNENEHSVGLRFDASFAQTAAWKALFADFYFSMDEDWTTTPAIDSCLQLLKPIHVQRGVYPVTISEKGISIWLEEPIRIVNKIFGLN